MTFDEAFEQMKAGKAAARPVWGFCLFWFYQQGRLWKLSPNGVRMIPFVNSGFLDVDDWYIVEGAEIPTVPAPKAKKESPVKTRTFRDRLKDKQERMRREGLRKPAITKSQRYDWYIQIEVCAEEAAKVFRRHNWRWDKVGIPTEYHILEALRQLEQSSKRLGSKWIESGRLAFSDGRYGHEKSR